MKNKTSILILSLVALIQSLAFADSAKVTLKVMASNLTSTPQQGYDDPGIRIIQGLKPDVVLVQEFNYKSNSSQDIQEFVTRTMGEDAHYYRESESSDRIANGVLSRFPIVESGEWQDDVLGDRDFAWARIDIPGKRDLWAISVHMKSGKGDKAKRDKQARAIMAKIQEVIPAEDYVVLGGDSNASAKTENFFKIFSGESDETKDYHTHLSQAAFPSRYTPGLDAASNWKTLEATNMSNAYPYDIVLGDDDLNAYQVPLFLAPLGPQADDPGFTAPNGLVFDSTVFPRLDLVPPVEKSDSRPNQNMQHLGVIKQFSIPTDDVAPEAPKATESNLSAIAPCHRSQ